MKFQLIAAVVANLIASQAYAGAASCMGYACDNPMIAFGVMCAPEVVEGNLAATDRVLAGLASSPEFAEATLFQGKVKEIAGIKDPATKFSASLAVLDIDSSKSADVAEFIGAREPKTQWLASLERNLQLSSAQANKVVMELSASLQGQLK